MRVTLKAPLSGVVVPIVDVPDPVFSGKLVGDGVSIDPVTTVLVAPCSGRVAQIHPSHHAVTLQTADGLEILIHVGLDTVNLRGQGFTVRAAVGDRVTTGDPLLEFDPGYIAAHARSLLTPLIVTSMDRVSELVRIGTGLVAAGVDDVFTITLSRAAAATAASSVAGASVVDQGPGSAATVRRSGPLVVTSASGLHARPAAVLASRAKQFDADIRVRRGSVEVNARSVVGIMGLEIDAGDAIEIVASGRDADEAVAALAALVREGLGEAAGSEAPRPAAASPPARHNASSADPHLLSGIPAAPGVVVGTTRRVRPEQLSVVEEAADCRAERRRLDDAVGRAQAELDELRARLEVEGAGARATIFAAHRELLDDPDLLAVATAAIDGGKSAAFGWQRAFTQQAERLAALSSELLAARANDVRDVGLRVLQKLAGVESSPRDYPADTVLIAEELTPSDTATLDRSKVRGLCSTSGGATSHIAILARALDVPLITGIDPRALDVPDGTPVILDGGRGTLRLNPSTADIARVRDIEVVHARARETERAHAGEPAITADGHRVEVAANIGGLADAEQGVALGAEGVGLLRSEFLFLNRATPPSEAEQRDLYAAVARVLGRQRRLVIRTLDVGGDKPLSYLPLPREENPFLGERGIRVSLSQPELLRAQLRAVLGAAGDGRIAVMFPMIATIDEWRAARRILDEEQRRAGAVAIETGIMVEVPSAAVMAEQFAREVDFFSIGTNDLTQYVLAMDRGNPRLAAAVDGLSPAVLSLINMTVAAAKAHGRWTSVCGGLGSDPQAVPLLIGLGVDELSVSVPAIPAVKAQIRSLRLSECRRLVAAALGCSTATAVRALVAEGQFT